MKRSIHPYSNVRGSPNRSQTLSECLGTEKVTEGLFPRSTERGPIEASSGNSCVTDNASDFRVQQNAAPLKRGIDYPIYVSFLLFPRSTERGPIEASRTYLHGTRNWYSFPRSTERGPIEAMN
jgi:hypothetical protein